MYYIQHSTWKNYVKSPIWDMTKDADDTKDIKEAYKFPEDQAKKVADILNTLEGREKWLLIPA